MVPLKMSAEEEARMHDLRLDKNAFLREVERRAGASREEMLSWIYSENLEEAIFATPNEAAVKMARWLRRIIGEKP